MPAFPSSLEPTLGLTSRLNERENPTRKSRPVWAQSSTCTGLIVGLWLDAQRQYFTVIRSFQLNEIFNICEFSSFHSVKLN